MLKLFSLQQLSVKNRENDFLYNQIFTVSSVKELKKLDLCLEMEFLKNFY